MEIRREVDLAASPEEVWPCLSDVDGLAEWLGGAFELDGEQVEAGATGTFTEPDGTVRRVLVGDVSPGRSVAWTWWTDDDEPPSSVSIAVEPSVGGTAHVVVVERQLVAAVPVARARATALATVG